MIAWLQSLSADQQVQLLFVALFGLLLLVSAGAALHELRERSDRQEHSHQRFKRELRATWIGAVVFWAAWISGPGGATVLLGVISFLALREYVTLVRTRRGDHRSLLLAFSRCCRCSMGWWPTATSTCSRCSSRSTCSWPSR